MRRLALAIAATCLASAVSMTTSTAQEAPGADEGQPLTGTAQDRPQPGSDEELEKRSHAVRYVQLPAQLVDQFVTSPASITNATQLPGQRTLVQGRAISLDLTQGVVATFSPLEVAVTSTNPLTVEWFGDARDKSGVIGSAALSVVRNDVGVDQIFGSVSLRDRNYQVQPLDDTVHGVFELDDKALPIVDGPPNESTSQEVLNAAPESAAPFTAALAGGATIDVLVAYTSGVSSSQISARINELNSAIANTAGLPHRANLVGTMLVSYTPHGTNMGVDLDRLATPGDGHLDIVLAQRTSLGADLVALFRPTPAGGVCGLGQLPPSFGNSNAAFSVSAVDGSCNGIYVVAHELGHNLGAHHNPEDAGSSCGAFTYSCGHFANGKARTIMSYDRCPNGCPPRLQFSSPVVDLIGYPGTPSGIANQRDNGATVNNMASVIANYRSLPSTEIHLRNTPTPGSPHASFSYGIASYTHLLCDFNGDGDDGIVVYDNGTWYWRETASAGPPDGSFQFGFAGAVPVCANWDGVGGDGIGIYNNGAWDIRQSASGGAPDGSFSFGFAGPQPVTGNWDGAGGDGIGIYNSGAWDIRQTPTAGLPHSSWSYGYANTKAVTGNWDGLGGDGIGVFDNGSWSLRQTPTAGAPDAGGFAYGVAGYRPLVGDHNNDTRDGVGVVVPP